MKNLIALALSLGLAAHSLGQGPESRYSIAQAISDKAQLHTIAFSGLAFITGDFGASTFMPPGKVCDFFGFQYMRDIDQGQKGHNPAFLNRVAGNVIHTLDEKQLQTMMSLAEEQAPLYEKLARMRLPLIQAFCRELRQDRPKGSGGLDEKAVASYLGDLYALDGEVSYRRAEALGALAHSLSSEQKNAFKKLKFGDFASWPDIDERDALRSRGRGKPQLVNVAFMTYASEFYSWYAGNLEADTYFCPERHGTYFGGFYMKDMPAMGKRDYDIGLNVTGDSGRAFLDVLTPKQRTAITSILDKQRASLAEVVTVRRKISTLLRQFLENKRPAKTDVVALCRRYGQLDGSMSTWYASAFAEVNRSLTSAQREELTRIRNLPGYRSAPWYLYSRAMNDAPDVGDTDRFFGKGGAAK